MKAKDFMFAGIVALNFVAPFAYAKVSCNSIGGFGGKVCKKVSDEGQRLGDAVATAGDQIGKGLKTIEEQTAINLHTVEKKWGVGQRPYCVKWTSDAAGLVAHKTTFHSRAGKQSVKTLADLKYGDAKVVWVKNGGCSSYPND